MAVVNYQSSQTATSTATTAVVTKPVSLAVGDLMIGIQAAQIQGGTATLTPPAGWTTELSGNYSTDRTTYAVYSKIADSTDVAASNFTFTRAAGSGNGCMVAAITRFVGQNNGNIVDQIGENAGTSGSSIPTASITPTVLGSTMLMIGFYWDSGSRTLSGYTITTNNPTWTEAYDIAATASSPSLSVGMGVAYAYRPQNTATGVGSITLNSSTEIFKGVILNLGPAPIPTSAMSFVANGIRAIRYSGQIAAMTLTALIPTANTVAAKWKNAVKNTSTWLNQDKS